MYRISKCILNINDLTPKLIFRPTNEKIYLNAIIRPINIKLCKHCLNRTLITHNNALQSNHFSSVSLQTVYRQNISAKTSKLSVKHKTNFSFSNNELLINRLLPLNACFDNKLSFGESRRFLHTTRVVLEKDSSKVEQTVKALREEVQKKLEKDKTIDTSVEGIGKPVEAVIEAPKRSIAKRVWDEIVHYYHGFRLLIIDIRITSRLIWKVLNGGDLTRREHKQLVRTSSDVFRLLPFSVFIIVPFMELLLPVFLKLFPNMLPSTFQTSSDKETKIKKQLKLKLEMAKFLQTTLDEMTLQAKGESHSNNAKEFAEFFNKIRNSGHQATNKDIIKFSKLFEDEITLDSLSRPQLAALCRLLELQPIGTNNFLRFQLRMKLRSLKADDHMIKKEGIESLTVPELQQACRSRGMRALGMSEERLRNQLAQWLDLSLSENIPPSLLLLSRVLYLPENIEAADKLKATIQALPEEVGTEARYKIGETEGKIDNRTKLELIKQEEAAIRKEKEEEEAVAKQKLQEEKEAVAKQKLVDMTRETLVDTAPIITDKSIDIESVAQPKEKLELSKEDIASIESALEKIAEEKSKLLIEKEEFDELKEEIQDYKEDIEEFKEIAGQTGKQDLKESKAAKRLRNKVDKMVNKMDKVFTNLDSKKQTLQQTIDLLAKEGKSSEKETGDVISINEVLSSIRGIQKVADSSDDPKLQRILEVLDNMDIDHDGQIEVDHVVKVLELLGRENVEVSPKQMKDIINLLIQEEKLEDEKKKLEEEKKRKQIEEKSIEEKKIEKKE